MPTGPPCAPVPEGVYLAAATADVRREGVPDSYIEDMVRDAPFRAAVEAAYRAALNTAYWKLREHASGYRGADAFRERMEAYRENRDDHLKARKALTHEFYARGIEAGARTVAELLGVPEHEIEEVTGA